ncbi:MAG: uroporphyrinogen decarboxylase family protein [Anaerolineae bacterium]
MPDELTPFQRTMQRMAGRPVDRAPNQNILMAFAARFIGATYDQLAQDYRVLVEANLRACEAFHIDLVSAISDPLRETSAFGAEVTFPYDSVPACRQPLLSSAVEWQRLTPWDPWNAPRTLDRLRAVQRYRERVGGYYPICGWVEGAAAEAGDLLGVACFLEETVTAPEEILALLEVCTQAAIRFAVAQVEAGADIVGIGDALASLMSPRTYRTFALPYEQRIIRAVHAAGGRVKLHICGNTSRHLADMAVTGADIIDVDWMVDLGEAVRTFHGVACANGNFDPVSVLLQGTPEEVAQAVRNCLAVADERLMVSAGCEVPVDTPHANLLAHYQALGEAGNG